MAPPGACQYASRTGTSRLVGRPFSANSTAACSKIACGTTSSTRPAFSACRGRSCLPVSIISSAVLTPISRGKRCVPPEPAAGQAVPPASRVGFFVIATDTAMTGQRQLQTAAKAGAVDSGNHRDRQAMDLSHNLLVPGAPALPPPARCGSGQSC